MQARSKTTAVCLPICLDLLLLSLLSHMSVVTILARIDCDIFTLTSSATNVITSAH